MPWLTRLAPPFPSCGRDAARLFPLSGTNRSFERATALTGRFRSSMKRYLVREWFVRRPFVRIAVGGIRTNRFARAVLPLSFRL